MIVHVRRGRQRIRRWSLLPLVMLAFLAGIGAWCEFHVAGEEHHHAVRALADASEHESDSGSHCLPNDQTSGAARAQGDSFSPAAAAAVPPYGQLSAPPRSALVLEGRDQVGKPSPVQLFCIQRI